MAQAIYPMQALKEPATLKFFYYWIQERDRMKATLGNLKLIDATEILYDNMLKETGITPESIDYDKNAKIVGLLPFASTDPKKEFDEYMETYRPFGEACQEEIIFGKDEVFQRYISKFPKYKGLLKYNSSFTIPNYTLNTKLFCDRLNDYLSQNKKNVQLLYGHEVEKFIFHEEEGKKHLVKGINIKNQD